MPFSIRPFRRVPVCCPVTYQCGLFEGHGIVWNLSVNGWRKSWRMEPYPSSATDTVSPVQAILKRGVSCL